ncbi:MAG: carboxypeptidase regulatory-like domain-containing protein [Armatimonadetes bacterium]|nr:carboxypeptidase regulatory-like domain-containing protein [Armatimonadota bacterium]
MTRSVGLALLLACAQAGGAVLEGRVTLPGGRPAAGAWVVMVDCGCGLEHRQQADERGRYRFESDHFDLAWDGAVVAYGPDGLAADTTARRLRPPQYYFPGIEEGLITSPVIVGDDWPPEPSLGITEPARLDLTLAPWVRAAGQLLTVDDQPLAVATVRLARLPVGRGASETVPVPAALDVATTSDARGRWHVDRWPACDGVLAVSHRQYRVVPEDAGHLWTNRRPRYRVGPASSVSGRVTDPSGRPVRGAVLTAEASGDECGVARTDAAGRYRFGHLETHTLWQGAVLVGLSSLRSPVVAGAAKRVELVEGSTVEGIDFVAQPGALLDVAFVDERTGRGVPGVRVWGSVGDGDTVAPTAARTGDDGHLTLRALPGAFDLAWELPWSWFAEADQTSVQGMLRTHTARTSVTVRLTRGRELRGVVTEGGRPLDGITIERDRSNSATTTDHLGRFVLPAVPPSKEVVLTAIEPSGLVRGELTVDATAHRPAPVAFDVAPVNRTTFSGRVLDNLGRPASRATLRLEAVVPSDQSSWGFQAETDGEGFYQLAGDMGPPASQPYTLSVWAEGRTSTEVSVSTGAAQTQLPDIVMVAVDAVVRGRVVDSDGRPVFYAVVRSPDGFHHDDYSTRTDAEGRFVLSGLEHGPRRIVAGLDQRYGEAMLSDGADGPDLVLRPITWTSDAERCAVASRALQAGWPDNCPGLLASVDAPAATRLLERTAGGAIGDGRGFALDLLDAIDAAPSEMVGTLRLADRLPGPLRAAVRLIAGLALVDDGQPAMAAQLLDATPLTEPAHAVTEATRALLAARLDRPGAGVALRQALDRASIPGTDRDWAVTLAWLTGARQDLLDAITNAVVNHASVERAQLANAVALARRSPEAAVDSLLHTLGDGYDAKDWQRWLPVLAAGPSARAAALRDRLPATAQPAAALLAGVPVELSALALANALSDFGGDDWLPLAAMRSPEAIGAWLARQAPPMTMHFLQPPSVSSADLARRAALLVLNPGMVRSECESQRDLERDYLLPGDARQVVGSAQLLALSLLDARRALQMAQAIPEESSRRRALYDLGRFLSRPSPARWQPDWPRREMLLAWLTAGARPGA